MKSELKKFIRDINALDAQPKNKENREKRSKKGKEILALDIGGKDMNKSEENTTNKVNEEFIACVKKEFYEKYGGNYESDVTKELKYLFSGNLTKDIKYHGKHRGYNMFTYLTETNVLMAVCPVFRLDMSEKDIDLLIKELRGLIDDFISFGRKNGGLYNSLFLGKTIRV